jgi:hypothetical protein
MMMKWFWRLMAVTIAIVGVDIALTLWELSTPVNAGMTALAFAAWSIDIWQHP